MQKKLLLIKKNIVIVGAGFGGLKVALSLARGLQRLRLLDQYQIMLIDRNEHHVFTPLLYEVATTSKKTANIINLHKLVAHPIATLVKNYPITFINDEVKQILPQSGESVILSKQGPLQASYLILALGSETNYYDIPGLKEHSFTLKNFTDAIRIRDKIENLTSEKGSNFNIVIGGGGATGVELAGEISSWQSQSKKEFRRGFSISIVQGGPTILSGMDSRLVRLAEERLKNLGVEIKTNTKITKLSEKEVVFADSKTLPYDIFIWSGGITSSNILSKLPLKRGARDTIVANETMRCFPLTPDLELSCTIYGIGDNICYINSRTQIPVPAVAPAAINQAGVAAQNILVDIKTKEGMEQETRRTYIPIEYPYVVPVGGKFALAKIGSITISGFLGWILKGIIEFYYLSSIMSTPRAIKIWAQGLFIFIKNDRLG